ncbi:hypothetical protein [Pallidibacillus thermolactis]|jgi:pSer/pThr/pTyr-binding forkhead associated (FHA) protein|uniref:hypothetical protein n=1 Tax=Pallidibacillus thermolactis TaxID=251051 RepID=UPI0021DB4A29|nr:hypothetical protein [Pallidibacillus thermolactis]MCU9601754.1 hypothetical protein [Pallidibacillus thermolactis subsp. kokeshiiformis]
MSLCCRVCRIELKDNDCVVLDDFGVLRHHHCYDYENYQEFVDSVGKFENVRGKFPRFLLNVYKEVIAMGDNRSKEDISDEEVLATLAYTLGYLD